MVKAGPQGDQSTWFQGIVFVRKQFARDKMNVHVCLFPCKFCSGYIQTRVTGVVVRDGKVKESVRGLRHKFPGWQGGKVLGNKETYN